MPIEYVTPGPEREAVDALKGAAVVAFGTNWCGYCQAAEPSISEALAQFPDVRHIGVEDGPGRRLGRSFCVKLWPTLIFLKDGAEVSRLVRPQKTDEIVAAIQQIVCRVFSPRVVSAAPATVTCGSPAARFQPSAPFFTHSGQNKCRQSKQPRPASENRPCSGLR